jgi:hypothetical protein
VTAARDLPDPPPGRADIGGGRYAYRVTVWEWTGDRWHWVWREYAHTASLRDAALARIRADRRQLAWRVDTWGWAPGNVQGWPDA